MYPQIREIANTHLNHGRVPEIVMTCTVKHEVAFTPEDVLTILGSMASDSMAKIINQLGKSFNADQMAECYSVADLDEHGIEFIESMAFFLNEEKKRKGEE